MKIEYMRTAKKSYMIVKEADYSFAQYELNMIIHNEISSLLSFQIIVADGAVEYWYDVTGMQSLQKQFMMESVGEKQLRFLLQQLIELKSGLDEYLLEEGNICYATEMIFYDRFTERLRFCYIPGYVTVCNGGLRGMFEEILQRINHSDSMAVKLGYEMYERSVQADFVVEDCLHCLQIGLEDNSAVPEETVLIHSGFEEDEPLTGVMALEDLDEDDLGMEFLHQRQGEKATHRRKRKREKRKKISYDKILEEEREVLFAAETIAESNYTTEVFLEEDAQKVWELAYRGDGAEASFSPLEYPYFIGSDSQKSNGVLQSRTVSRVHARLTCQQERLYLEDFHSTNGTYVNKKLLPMNTPVELHDGDRVVFATEEYEVFCRRKWK